MLARHPYLGPAFEFTEREPGTAPFLGRLHNFTLGALPSLGITGAAITGMKYGVPRLVNGLVRDLFREDAAAHYRDLLAYAVPELEILESAFEWLDRLAAEALEPSDELAGVLSKRVRGPCCRPLAGQARFRKIGEIAHAYEISLSVLLRIGCRSERLLHSRGD